MSCTNFINGEPLQSESVGTPSERGDMAHRVSPASQVAVLVQYLLYAIVVGVLRDTTRQQYVKQECNVSTGERAEQLREVAEAQRSFAKKQP